MVRRGDSREAMVVPCSPSRDARVGGTRPGAGKVVARSSASRSGAPVPPPGEGGPFTTREEQFYPWSTRSPGAIGPGAPSSSQRPSRPHRRPRTQPRAGHGQPPRRPELRRRGRPEAAVPRRVPAADALPPRTHQQRERDDRDAGGQRRGAGGQRRGSLPARRSPAPRRGRRRQRRHRDPVLHLRAADPPDRRRDDHDPARSGSTARGRMAPSGPSGPDDIDEIEDAEDSRPIGERARWALAIGVVAAVVVLGLAIGYAVLGLGDDNQGTVPPPRRPPARWARRRRPAPPSRRPPTAARC